MTTETPTNLVDLLKLTAAELQSRALNVPRFISIMYTQLSHAVEATNAGQYKLAQQHYEAATRACKRAQEDEASHLRRVAQVQAVVEERGAAQDASKGMGKVVARNRMSTAYTFKWNDNADVR